MLSDCPAFKPSVTCPPLLVRLEPSADNTAPDPFRCRCKLFAFCHRADESWEVELYSNPDQENGFGFMGKRDRQGGGGGSVSFYNTNSELAPNAKV